MLISTAASARTHFPFPQVSPSYNSCLFAIAFGNPFTIRRSTRVGGTEYAIHPTTNHHTPISSNTNFPFSAIDLIFSAALSEVDLFGKRKHLTFPLALADLLFSSSDSLPPEPSASIRTFSPSESFNGPRPSLKYHTYLPHSSHRSSNTSSTSLSFYLGSWTLHIPLYLHGLP